MKAFHFRLRRLCAILIGLVFLCSGLLKLIDPVGTGLIVSEYLKFFRMDFLTGLARPLGIALVLVETVTGVALITGVYCKLSAIVTGILLVFFTGLTLVLLIVNPEMDCGCFGEALHLTHRQSFFKNVALVILALVAFIPFRHFGTPRGKKYVTFWIASASLVFALWYSGRHLPLIDFMEFAPGAELFAADRSGEEIPDGFYAAFIYERDGQTGSFSLDRLPDSTWTFVRVDTVYRNGLNLKPSRPILSFSDAAGEYQDERAVKGKVVVLSVYDPARAAWDRIVKVHEGIQAAGATPLLLVSSSPAEMTARSLPVPVYYADYKTLLTLNRGNGGATYINKGEVIAKWSLADFPKDPSGLFSTDPVDIYTHHIARRRITAQAFCLYLAALLILL